MKRRGLLVVVCGPSGVGKGTICKALADKNAEIFLSVSVTTRKPRNAEVDGVSYHFKTEEEFKEMIRHDELFEWAVYCNNYYGTPKQYIMEMLQHGQDVVLEIDVQGALKVKEHFSEGVFIFVLPPSMEELKKRIEGRGTETKESIVERLKRAGQELKLTDAFQYIIVNDELDHSVKTLEAIIIAEKCRSERNQEIIKGVLENDISVH